MNISPIDASGLVTSAIKTIKAIKTNTAPDAPATSNTPPVTQDTFLKLLVEQLKNQDPLAPQDGAQFIAQLAQFNSVEQLISINTKLGQLLAK